jgi:hypothetical protein
MEEAEKSGTAVSLNMPPSDEHRDYTVASFTAG